MHGLTPRQNAAPVVAVVGGGASGTLATALLLRCVSARRLPLRVVLIDRHGRHGRGQAYSTTHPAHLLNATAGTMSALPGRPDHLVKWGADVTTATFLPRKSYGDYLLDVLSEAERDAAPLCQVNRITSEVLSIRPSRPGRSLRLTLTDRSLRADFVVLAVGNTPAGLPFPAPRHARIVTDPWSPGALAGASDGSPVVVVGTGLTMLDVAVSVTTGSPATRVFAISRHGMLPRAHSGVPPAVRPIWLPAVARTPGISPQLRLTDLMWQVRAAVADSPENWQDTMASLRPLVPGLWHRLPEEDKRLFLRHVARYWEVHRHLVPPATAARITALRATGRLSVLRGRVTEVTERAGKLRVRVEGGDVTNLSAGWLISAVGSTTDIGATTDPLLRDLFAAGLARPDPLRLGIDASTDGAVLNSAGRPGNAIFTLGPPLRGLWYETTAIPEIREQAAALAERLTARLIRQARPGSAA